MVFANDISMICIASRPTHLLLPELTIVSSWNLISVAAEEYWIINYQEEWGLYSGGFSSRLSRLESRAIDFRRRQIWTKNCILLK